MKPLLFGTVMLAAAGLSLSCTHDGQEPVRTEPPDTSFEIELSEQNVILEAASAVEVAFTATGPGVSGIRFEAYTQAEGWETEVVGLTESPGPERTGLVRIVSPGRRSAAVIYLTGTTAGGEVRSRRIEAVCSGTPFGGDDPYSTPDEEKTVTVKPFGGSPVALSASLEPSSDVKRYYFGILAGGKVEEYYYRIGPEWKDYWRDQILEYLSAASFDYWDYEKTVYRFEADPDGEPLEENTAYYIYVVTQRKNGEPGQLELTRVSTTAKDNGVMPACPADHVAVEHTTVYDATTVTLTPDDYVRGYYYNLIDQDYIDEYVELYGRRWDAGFLDKWDYYLTCEYADRLSHDTESYSWTNLTPKRTYTLFVVYYDPAGILNLELTPITTPGKDPLTGTPRVAIEQIDIDVSTVAFRFAPNSDCGRYTVDIWSESDLAQWKTQYGDTYYQELINYAAEYGRITSGHQEITLDINDFYPVETGSVRTWADNRYDLVVLPFDRKGVYDETGVSYTHIAHGAAGGALRENNRERVGSVAEPRLPSHAPTSAPRLVFPNLQPYK